MGVEEGPTVWLLIPISVVLGRSLNRLDDFCYDPLVVFELVHRGQRRRYNLYQKTDLV